MLSALTAHVDTFTRDRLPPVEQWPLMEFSLPELQFPERLNAAVQLLDHTVAKYGAESMAVRSVDFPELTFTYGELQQRVNQVARLLVEDHGVVPGNRVLLRIPNNPWAVVLWLAVLKAGAVAVTTMVAWRSGELSSLVERIQPTVAVVDHRFVDDVADVWGAVPVLVLGGETDVVLGASAAKPSDFVAVETSADDVALLCPTSGTTGLPKITMHFHRDIMAIAETFGRHTLEMCSDDVVAGSPPLAFTFGLGGLVIFPLRCGASTVLIERANPLALADAIEQYDVSVLFTAPTGYRAMVKEGRGDALRRLRVGVSAGEDLPRETFELVEEASGVRLVNGIGATEMLHVFISAAGSEIVPGCTGKEVPGFRATVVDLEGKQVPPGVMGRLAVVGPTGCRYFDDERQLTYVQHGWNITGDTYSCDAQGYFTYHGRSDDMIVASGYNIGASEVEAAIDTHPDVMESAVVARPTDDGGVIVNAFVALRPGVQGDDALRESIQATVRARLAPYKIPRRVDFVDALPRNASGKLQRFPLRQRAHHEARLVSGRAGA